MPNQKFYIRELEGFKDIGRIFPLVFQLNPDITEKEFCKRLKNILKERRYRCIAAFSRTSPEVLLGCAGFWIGTRFWCGVYIEPDNVVVDRAYRGQGIGEKLMQWIEKEGKRRKCRIIKLEAYAANSDARKFYGANAYEEPGVVIVKPLLVNAKEWRAQLQAKAK